MMILIIVAAAWLVSAHSQGLLGSWAVWLAMVLCLSLCFVINLSEHISNAKKDVSEARACNHETSFKKIA